MFASLLIANRGEIAVRVIRTARRMGLRTIAIYSDADRDAMHVELAEAAYRIGPAPAAESYLRGDQIIDVARKAGAEAIHPGYGLLSENADFAEACAAAGLTFVGPSPAAMRVLGAKDAAKALMQKAGVPVVPGYYGTRQDPEFLREKAYEVGYPVLVKAVAGGGGRGMRRVDKQIEFSAELEAAQREAEAAFGDRRVMIEKAIGNPRHVEVQIFADSHGNAVHLFDRDCSIQRRHQKVVEEAPAPGLCETMRAAMGEAAVAAARAAGYENAGTVEFIVEGGRDGTPGAFHFMEMNARLQVEHPVTEAVTGCDLVEWQLRVAAGEALPCDQAQLELSGHAIEARLYAEDPERDFAPSSGRLVALELAEGDGIRVDAGVRAGDAVSPYYDPLIAKLIAHGATRTEALDKMTAALANSVVAGPRTNLTLLRRAMADPDYRAGTFDTGFIAARKDSLLAMPVGAREIAMAEGARRFLWRETEEIAGRRRGRAPAGPWDALDGFQLGPARRHGMTLMVDGQAMTCDLTWDDGEPVVATPDGGTLPIDHAEQVIDCETDVLVLVEGRQFRVGRITPGEAEKSLDDTDGVVRSPMHGRVVSVHVATGEIVDRGHKLAVIEAMKMEHPIVATLPGEVAELAVSPGDQVAEGQRLLTIELRDEAGTVAAG